MKEFKKKNYLKVRGGAGRVWHADHSDWKNQLDSARKHYKGEDASPSSDHLQEHWASIGRDNLREDMRKNIEDFDNPLEALIGCISRYGMYPPPELLDVIAAMYHKYLDYDGELTLDEIFLPRPIPGKGNYSKIKSTEETNSRFYSLFRELIQNNANYGLLDAINTDLIFWLRSSDKNEDIRKDQLKIDLKTYRKWFTVKNCNHNILAEVFILLTFPGLQIDVDSFLRTFRKWSFENTAEK